MRLVTDEADAVLALLAAGDGAPADTWQALFASEGYVRLKAREDAMGRGFGDADFRDFVESPELRGRAAELAATGGIPRKLQGVAGSVAREGSSALLPVPRRPWLR